MADSLLSTSSINNFVQTYITNETNKFISPLNTQKSKYQKLSSAYTTLSSKLTSLKSVLADLKLTGSSSAFNPKSATTSNSAFVTAVAGSTAAKSSYTLRVNQLAKSDIALSRMIDSDTANTIAGAHNFVIKTGDGNGGEYTSNIEVEFGSAETNQSVMEKIREAINSDKAVVKSSEKTGTHALSAGVSSFKINIGGSETTVSVDVVEGETYDSLISKAIESINANVKGVTAEKVEDSGNVSLKLTVNDSTKYISISHDGGTDLITDLGIGVTKEKGASGLVTASVFSPGAGNSQFSITSKEAGLDYRITSLYDESGSDALSQLGLDLSTTRTSFSQDTNVAGFMYSDITSTGNQLNTKVIFNGISVQRNNNTFSDLAPGVTFTLKSVMRAEDADVTVSVNNDISGIKSKIESFITRFNDVYSYLKSNTSYSSGTRGPLASDGNSASLLNFFKTLAYTEVTGLPEDDLNKLSEIGISFNINTGISISDSAKLEQKLSENVSQVEAIFNSSNGISNLLYNKVDPFLGATGYLQNTKTGYDKNITYYNSKIKTTQTRIDKSAEVLRGKYEKLQTQMASLLTSQEYINGLLGY